MDPIIAQLAEELDKDPRHVENVVRLLDEGNTIPFIARYRKELHGAMDDTSLRTLEERLHYLRGLAERKEAVKSAIEEQGKLTAELSAAIDTAATLAEVEDLYRDVTGQELPHYYRPPQGIYSQENLAMAQELGYKTVFWSLAYVDWNNDSQPTREEAFAKLLPRIHNGAVVLLHSTSKTNAAILDELLTRWEEMGYRFGTLEELTVNSSSTKGDSQ